MSVVKFCVKIYQTKKFLSKTNIDTLNYIPCVNITHKIILLLVIFTYGVYVYIDKYNFGKRDYISIHAHNLQYCKLKNICILERYKLY